MKKTFFILITALSVLIGCNNKPDTSPGDGSAKGVDTIPKAASEYGFFEKGIATGRSTADTAEMEIKQFLGHSNLKDWAQKWALGGEFESIGDFFPRYETDTIKGTLAWFVYDTTEGKPRIILACEGWQRDLKDNHPRSQVLTIPDKLFTFADDSSKFKLEDHRSLITRTGGRMMRNGEANERTTYYQRNVMTRLYWSGTTPFNNDYGAFFQNNLENNPVSGKPDSVGLLTRFVNQPGARGMRYYFALDNTEKQNKIRIFLIATDSAGNNLLDRKPSETNAVNAMDEPSIIIQKSIPPGGPGKRDD